MLLIDKCHQAGIGVILDWVPSHFPDDQHGLSYFDGTHLYEHHDPQKGFHPDWKSYIFNYGRNEVRSFLISNAIFWMEKYHIDALRIDAVSSMLYLDYSRKYGEWTPNEHGGRINLEALHFLRELNAAVYSAYPDTHLIAEESTDYPRVSRPVEMDGVGFGMKWDMGWMHDSLKFLSRDPVHRPHHQNDITFRSVYAFTENFMLPLSHDEVVYGKKSLMSKMPGDGWQQAAHLRSLFAYMYASPGKKLIFMGGEYGQWTEWNHNISLDWHLLGYDTHQGIHRLVTDLNFTYRAEESLFNDFDPAGFEWVDGSDTAKSVIAFLRKTPDGKEFMLCVFNFSGSAWQDYRIGVPHAGPWSERINSDNLRYGGSGGLNGDVRAQEVPHHGRPYSLCLRLPAASGIWLRWKP
jgi:1,4-alpha-glucan branching enzyme